MKKPPKKVTPKVRTARHAAALKAARTRAKKVTPAVKAARHAAALRAARTRAVNKAKPRQLSPGAAVACCAAEALAASLRLSGRAVSGQDVLALYWHTASDPDAGASILATLEAASEFGLAGLYPRWVPVTEPLSTCGFVGTGQPSLSAHEVIVCAAEEAHGIAARKDAPHAPLTGPVGAQFRLTSAHGLILGLTLPGGPHAVLDTGSEWISWGEPWPVTTWPDVVIEEVWTIEWEVP